MTDSRKLIVSENISANGVIEFLDPWFDPGQQDDQDLLDLMRGHAASETALVLGRRTFEEFRGYWPKQTHDPTGFTAHLNQVPKYVVSASMTDPAWGNSAVLSGALADEIRSLKANGSSEVGVTGSISVVHELMRTELIDEYRLFVFPVTTSRGRNLVPDGLSMQGLTLRETRAFSSGVVFLNYARGLVGS